ncbi:MAG: GNAT family N-acetyltransferase [Acetobacteraceae bacterium]
MSEAGIRIVCLTREAEIARLAPEWMALYQRAGRSLFQNPHWHHLWWDHLGYAEGWRAYTIAAYESGGLIAVAPLAVCSTRGIRQLEWAGVSFFDYPDLLADDHVDALSIWRAIRCLGGYDIARLRDVRADGRSFSALTSLVHEAAQTTQVYAADLTNRNGQEWFAGLSKRTRANHAASLRRLAETGATSLHRVTAVSAIPNVVGQLVAQKMAWAEKRGIATPLTKRSKIFLEKLALQALSEGVLHLSTLRSGEQTTSTHLGFVSKDGFYYYLPSYHPGFAAMSPGRVHMIELIKWAADNGYPRFDFLRGEDRYKANFGKQARELHDFTFPAGLLGRLAIQARSLRRRVGRIPLQMSGSR